VMHHLPVRDGRACPHGGAATVELLGGGTVCVACRAWKGAERFVPCPRGCVCECGGTGKAQCSECEGEGTLECNLGETHDCEPCAGRGALGEACLACEHPEQDSPAPSPWDVYEQIGSS